MTARAKLEELIENLNYRDLSLFLRLKSPHYAEIGEGLPGYEDERFQGFRKIGEIRFETGERLAVVASPVSGELSERSGKKAQYDKARRILKDQGVYDGGFFIFHDPEGHFRFSLVYAQFEGVKRTFNNFRRFTYFVSKDQTNKTFLQRVGEGDFSSLEMIKDAFSVEKVNKEFYKHIAQFFYRLTGYNHDRLLKLPSVPDSDKQKYQEFAVRLIGRAIFCWFLKHKKSAEGIPLIPESLLSSEAVRQNNGYYHNVLEKLFFEILNTPREYRKPDILSGSQIIPFLNGGLFDPHKDDFYNGEPLYNLVIPDDWFEEFFEILEQYNFTIDENSPTDAEVSVDPEMLGRIFENLLAEVNPETGESARKATGSYYTPRIIVDYMVDQSLIQYLKTRTGIEEGKLEALVSYDVEDVALTEAEKEVVFSALDRIKIIDPACGSGAFPMGMLHKMLLVLEKVDPRMQRWLKQNLGSIRDDIFRQEILEKAQQENWEYLRKLSIIQSAIYGVDIQPIAVEISKLRFFLSLVVDEQVDDARENRGIKPLPNLEFKFVAANTLIGLPPVFNQQLGFGNEEIMRLKELRGEYLRSWGEKKRRIQEEFLSTRGKLFEHSVTWGGKDALALQLANWNPFENRATDWFDPDWMFGVGDGFDVVIANPPYVRQEQIKELKPRLQKHYECYTGVADIYVYFYERGFGLLGENGVLTFISSNKYFRSGYGQKLRQFLASKATVHQLIDFGDAPVFDAIAYPSIIVLSKRPPDANQTRALNWEIGSPIEEFDSVFRANSFRIAQKELTADGWRLESPAVLRLLEKLRRAGKPLGEYVNGRFYRGILTGLNEAFVVDRATRDRLIAEHPSSAEVLKPFLRGRDVKRWMVEPQDLWLIFTRRGIDIKKYPAILAHLEMFREKLTPKPHDWDEAKDGTWPGRKPGSYEWYEIQDNIAYWQQFEKPKIIIPAIAQNVAYAPDFTGYYTNDKTSICVGDSAQYLLALLNSQTLWWLIRHSAATKQGGFFEFKPMYVSRLPIPPCADPKPIEGLVDRILAAKATNPAADVSDLEREIDERVYRLYGLTKEEIGIVEGNPR